MVNNDRNCITSFIDEKLIAIGFLQTWSKPIVMLTTSHDAKAQYVNIYNTRCNDFTQKNNPCQNNVNIKCTICHHMPSVMGKKEEHWQTYKA